MEPVRRASHWRGPLPLADFGAVAWLTGLTLAFLAPALSRGAALGPYDLLHALGLTHTLDPHVHNAVDSDEIQEFIPWQVLAWRQVHAGHLPLWDPFNLLGMPYGFNFESAPFGLTTAVGYVFPLPLAHTATVAVRLVLAGLGAYGAGRVLRLAPLAAAVGATVFELSGAFTIWDGTFRAGAYCFTGWVLAASVLVLRGRRRVVPGILLALALALVFSSGDPQVDLLLVAFVGVFVAVVCVVRLRRARGADRRALRRTAWMTGLVHVLALIGGAALAAPAYLPSVQLLTRSARSSGPYVTALPPVDLTHLVFAGYDGVATTTASQLGSANVYNAAVYVGAVALVLALCALAWWRWRPEVVALSTCTVLVLVALFAPPVVSVMRRLPELKVFSILFATTLLDFGLAMLCAYGFAALTSGRLTCSARGGDGATDDPTCGAMQSTRPVSLWSDPPSPASEVVRRSVLRLFCAGTAVVALAVVALGMRFLSGHPGLTAAQAHVRAASFLWPSISIAALLVVAAVLLWSRRRGGRQSGRRSDIVVRHGAMLVLLVVETAFLVLSGAWTGSSASAPLTTPEAVATIRHGAAGGLVGIGTCVENAFPGLGVMPNANILYRLDELTEYDPILPDTYYSSYGALAHRPGKPLVPHVLCPAVTSVRIARFYGVSDILEPAGAPGPQGTVKVVTANGESLYSVAGTGRATLVPLDRSGGKAVTVASAPGQRVAPSSAMTSGGLVVHVSAHQASLLILRVTDVPGWGASIDGRPLPLHSYGGVLLAATVPPGRHLVSLTYFPPLLRDGLIASGGAGVAILVLLGAAIVSRHRRRAVAVQVRDSDALPVRPRSATGAGAR